MSHRRRTNIVSGIILILVGAVLLISKTIPGLSGWFDVAFTWPMIIVLVALGLLVIGMVSGEPDMVVPACVVGGIGGILYFQNAGVVTWQSWAYLWTLIPGFAGIGELLAGVIKWKKKQITEGLATILVSAVLFTIFGSLLGGLVGFFPFRTYLPYLLILLGIFLFIRALVRPNKHSSEQ